MPITTQSRMSWEEYVERERLATEKSEFYAGERFEMPRCNARHCRIGTNLICEIGNALLRSDALVFGSNLRILCPTGLATYPDCSVVCGEPELLDAAQDTLLNPIVIFEVLSPSTEAYDRGKKFEHYESLTSLQEYVLVSQDQIRVEHFARQSQKGQWLRTVVDEVASDLMLPAIDVSISMSQIYAKVNFEEAGGADGS